MFKIEKTKLFYVLLTVQLGIFLVNNQPDAQFFFLICLFQFSTCFEQQCAHNQESIYQYDIWYMSLCVADRLVCRLGWNSIQFCILDRHLYRVTYTKCRIDTTDSWWWAHGCSKHVENWNKHIRKKNCASSWLFTRKTKLFLEGNAAKNFKHTVTSCMHILE